jgi:DNA-binding HxlR family transcriptional regulator
VSDFRYAQFCPLARAAEVVGERWTLLIVRELLLGPKRFSDLRAALCGVSPSVLTDRLARLERRDVVAWRRLPPPAAARVYELTDTGRALEPVVMALARWGVRFLAAPEPGDQLEPDWVRLGLTTFARPGPTPERRFNVTAWVGDREAAFGVAGGPDGTRVAGPDSGADASLRAGPLAIFALASGRLDAARALRSGEVHAEGNLGALADFPELFEMQTPTEQGD